MKGEGVGWCGRCGEDYLSNDKSGEVGLVHDFG